MAGNLRWIALAALAAGALVSLFFFWNMSWAGLMWTIAAELLPDAVRALYKGALRVLLVLLHDFPEFLCDFHFSFCDAIPPSCIPSTSPNRPALSTATPVPKPRRMEAVRCTRNPETAAATAKNTAVA